MNPLKLVKQIRRRHRLSTAVQDAMAAGHCRIVVGASGVVPDGWIGTDIDQLNMLELSDWDRYFSPGSIDAILAEHVWEHLTPQQGLVAATMCKKYLRPGGILRVAVPDGYHVDPRYIDHVKPGGSGAGADDHKVLYTVDSFSKVLAEAGFQTVRTLEYFDKSGEFHAENWDENQGMVHRSIRFDSRNVDGKATYTSLILDAA